MFFLTEVMDLEKNDGSRKRPYFANKELMNILGLHNEFDSPAKTKKKKEKKKAKS